MNQDYPEVNLNLARRLEHAEGRANAAFVDARARFEPEIGARWMEVAGVYAMFDGVDSPLTQTFGLGLFDPFLEPEFDAVEAFFVTRRSSVFHEVSSFVQPPTLALLRERGYTPIEQSTVLVRPSALSLPQGSREVTVRRVGQNEGRLWARVAAEGWSSESSDIAEFVEKFGFISAHARGVHCFLAELEGQAVAAGSLSMTSDVALLAGASTIPSARRRGAQQALLRARLAFAKESGVDLAMLVAQPGSSSLRNGERQGFRSVYGRTKWQRARPLSGSS